MEEEVAKIRIGHIVNPVKVSPDNKSYLYVAQPVTFESMKRAQKLASESDKNIEVELFTVQYEEDREIIPEGFTVLPDLKRCAYNVFKIKNKNKKLPLLTDIIGSLYQNSEADFFVYSNTDIGVKPDFYIRLAKLIRQGVDGMCIHRQDFPKKDAKGGVYTVDRIDEIVKLTVRREHPGHDCVVFKRDMVPKMKFKKVFIGFPPVGAVLRTQVRKNATNFKEMRSGCRMTFHLGNDKAWEKNAGANGEYKRFNMDEGRGIYQWR